MKVAIPCVVAFTTIVVCSSGCVPRSSAPSIGFWYQTGSLTLPSAITTRLGGPLQTDESELIEQISRSEIENAFSDLGIHLTTNRDAFWRVEVVQSLPAGAVRQLPSAGRSLLLGPLGGRGAVGVDMVASKAIYYAPVDAPREHLIAGIGRGIGRVAVHEFFHQILGAEAAHNDKDGHSYEYGSPDRQAEYYGVLHWSTGMSLLRRRFGTEGPTFSASSTK
jgi:hypothetical protein